MTDLTDRAPAPPAAHELVAERLVQESADLMAVASWIEEHGADIPRPDLTTRFVPFENRTPDPVGRAVAHEREIRIYAPNADVFATAVRALAARAPLAAVVKETSGEQGEYMNATRRFGTVPVTVWTTRETVCERVQVGVETVEVPDPTVVVPTVEVEQPVYEWQCEPTLVPAGGSPAEFDVEPF